MDNGAIVTERKYRDLGPLHDLLVRACPPDAAGHQSIPILAAALGISAQGVYTMIHKNKVVPEKAVRIAQLSAGRVTLDDLSPYVFK